MRSLLCSLALAAATIGVLAASPSQAHAQLRRVGRPTTTTFYYNYTPNFNAYPWNYTAVVSPSLYNSWVGYNPYVPSAYAYYPPALSYSYTLPAYQYYYGPGYSQFYYTPGSYSYWLR